MSDAESESESLRLLRRMESKFDHMNARIERLAERFAEDFASSRGVMCAQLHATEKRLALGN